MHVLLAGIVAALVPGTGTNADRPAPWIGASSELDNYFIVKASAGHENSGSGGFLGRGDVNTMITRYHVVATTPVHRTPPRNWRNPDLASHLGLDRTWIFELDRRRSDIDTIVAAFAALPGVEGVWRDGHVDHCNTPNDTLWGSQWNLQKAKVDCEAAWDAVTKETVLVSIVDSGVDLGHKDLKANLWVNPNEVAGNGQDDDRNGYIDDINGWDFYNVDASPADDNGHGSHVAGIVGAVGDNGRDVTGVCWTATIQVVKVLDRNGTGTWTSISQGLVYAADNGAAVINMSLGGAGGDPGLDAAVAYARDLDVVQVAAAGNLATNAPFYPAAYDGVIAVMASDPNDNRPRWSNYGDWCDLIAPGDGVYSLWKSGLTNILSGTSQAAPHVAGVAALVRTLNPQLDRTDVELAIETSCDDLGAVGKDADYQWGRLNAREAICRAGMLVLEQQQLFPGQSSEIYVADASHPGDFYFLQPTLSGREPGYTLDVFFPGATATVPLNIDWLTMLSISQPHIGIFDDFIGTLDANGTATARLNLPKGNGLFGATIHFCGFTIDPNDTSKARRVMNSVGLVVR